MATVLTAGDIAIIHYNGTGSDSFSFVFLRAVDAGTSVNFTDNGWQAAGGFRPGEGTVTYTAPSAIAAGTIVSLTGLDLDDAGDQIIAYQGSEASPTILYVVDLADGNTTVAGDATDGNTTALPAGFALGVNAVALPLNNSLYAGPIDGSPAELFAAISNSANWIGSDTIPQIQLPEPFNSEERPDIDLDVNDSTHGGRDYRAFITAGGPAAKISDTDINISDANGTQISNALIRVANEGPGDLLAVNGPLPAGIVAQAFDPATGTLTLSGTATHADYEAAIQQIEFSTTASVGTQKRIEVSVFDGQQWSSDAKAFLTVGNVAAPPVLDLDANNSNAGGADYTATFTSSGPATPVADIDVSITDADSTTIQSARITIGVNRQSDDLLSIAGTLPAGITASSYDPITGVIALSGSASLADYQIVLRQVVYSSPDPTPFTGDRVIQVTVSDGTLDSNIGTTYMHVAVAPANVSPALDLDTNNSTTTGADYVTGFTEGGSAVAIVDADVDISDADSTNIVSATITLTNPQTDDLLSVSGLPAAISTTGYNPATGVLTLSGSDSLVNYEAALQQIQFSNINIDPSNVTRIINIVVNDGTSNSNTAKAFVQVDAVNNAAPVVDLDPDNSGGSFRSTFRTTFTENGTPVPIADLDTTITDADSTNLVSATITLANPQTDDLLAVSGALPGGITALAYNPGTGILTLTGSATLAQYEAALRQILYSNSGDNPATVDRVIGVVVNDGANESNVADAVIGIAAANDAPALVVANATYTENDPPLALSPLASVTDPDDTELNFATVLITDGFSDDGDVLSVGGVTSDTVNGITFAWVPALHTLTFSGASSVANYQALLQTVEFQSTSENPTNFDANPQRTLTWTVSDGASFTIETTTLDIIAVNDASDMTADATVVYTENELPVTVSPGATVTDVDDLTLIAGGVRIVGGAFDGDILSVNGLESGTFLGIDFSYNALTHNLRFTRPTSIADYQAFVQAIEFSSSSDDPTNGGLNPTRTLGWGVFDGAAISSVPTTTILINPIDDPAEAQNDNVATTENTAITAGNVFVDSGLGPDSDPDGGAFLVTAVSGGTVGTQLTLPSGALLTLNADGTFSYDPNHLFDYLPTPDSGASNLTITDIFSYTITGGDTATVTVTVSGVDTDDTLLDSPGNDTLAGGIRDDLYYVNNTGDVVIEAANSGYDSAYASVNYTLPASNTVEVLNMLGPGLTGTGSEGPETLISSFGANTLIGLGGDDLYYVRDTSDVVIEAANGGNDTVGAFVDYTLPENHNIETLSMLGPGLTGTGSSGADTLHSGAGPNTLEGRGGDDLYFVNNTDDAVIEAANGGHDTVVASVNYTLPDNHNIELLSMLGSGLIGTGSAGADTLHSNGGPNTLVGLGGDDLYYVNNAADVVTEAANGGYDTVVATVTYTLPANVDALYMIGSGLTGTGNSSANTLITIGANTLVGGDGNDTFEFFAGSANGATVSDFDRSEGDVLVFSGFGTEAQGATLTQIGTTDQWQIHSGLDAHNETIAFSNHAVLQAGDFVFV